MDIILIVRYQSSNEKIYLKREEDSLKIKLENAVKWKNLKKLRLLEIN